jgi:hypothetical protein
VWRSFTPELSFRHFYAVMELRNGIGVFEVARKHEHVSSNDPTVLWEASHSCRVCHQAFITRRISCLAKGAIVLAGESAGIAPTELTSFDGVGAFGYALFNRAAPPTLEPQFNVG